MLPAKPVSTFKTNSQGRLFRERRRSKVTQDMRRESAIKVAQN